MITAMIIGRIKNLEKKEEAFFAKAGIKKRMIRLTKKNVKYTEKAFK